LSFSFLDFGKERKKGKKGKVGGEEVERGGRAGGKNER